MGHTTSSATTNPDLITLGESMWRLSPPGQERLEGARSLNIHVGGAESNVASALARLGKRVEWWSRLPDHAPGHQVANTLRMHGVDTSKVRWVEGRLGTYYVEFSSPPRPVQVIYDRANSAASQMQPDDFPWEQLQGARWLHLTGITPALSESCLATVKRAIQEARKANVSISFDLNYRAKLWTPEQAARVLDELAAQCTLVIGAERDIQTLFHIGGSPEDILRTLRQRWPETSIVLTQGGNGSSAFDGNQMAHADVFPAENPIRIGAGDAFDAGLLCALMDGKPLADALTYGNALAALKMTMPGDIALVTREEIEQLISKRASDLLR